MNKFYFGLLLSLLSLRPALALVVEPVKLGAFIDTYYAYDFEHPPGSKRAYATQPLRHDQPDLNLSHIEAVLETRRVRGRLALQAGDSVDRNYNVAGERKLFQEAYLGYLVGEKTWIDAGIYFGHIGSENWISKDNWTYSRSLLSEFTPYYSTGVRISHQLSDRETLQLQVINGWQNMSENNSAKAIGFQYKTLLTDDLTFTYNTFFGDEEVVSSRPRFRVYHNAFIQWMLSSEWSLLYTLDLSHQAQQQKSGSDFLLASAFTARYGFSQRRSIAARIEYYDDPHQMNVVTKTPHGFEVIGASVNYDQKLRNNLLWRTELRTLNSKDAVFPTASDRFLVTSLSFWL